MTDLIEFYARLPERIQKELTSELKEILEADSDVLSCQDEKFRPYLAYAKLYSKHSKPLTSESHGDNNEYSK